MAFWRRTLINLSVSRRKHSSLAGHRNKHILSPHFPHFFGIGDNLLTSAQFYAKDFAQFKIIGFYKKGFVFQRFFQKITGRINNKTHSPAGKFCHNVAVKGLGQRFRNTARKNQKIPLLQAVKFFKKGGDVPFSQFRPLPVNFSLFFSPGGGRHNRTKLNIYS